MIDAKKKYKDHYWYSTLCNAYACRLGQEPNGFCKKHNETRDKNGDVNDTRYK